VDTNFTWKAEIIFRGDAKEFTQFSTAFEKFPIEVNIPEWKFRPNHLAGCFPFPIDRLLGHELIDKIIDGMPRMQIKFVKDIAGGIRQAHLHIGDEIVLLDQDRFRMFASTVASELATMLVDREGMDYVGVMGPINSLMEKV
jgi:hypothetical protein